MNYEDKNKTIVANIPCPECGIEDGAGDNLKVYEDSHGHCFACGYHPKTIDIESVGSLWSGRTSIVKEQKPFLIGNPENLHWVTESRRLSKMTLDHFNYEVSQDENGNWVQVANCYEGSGFKGQLVAQQLRYPNKPGEKKFMPWRGQFNGLYGQWLWSPTPNLFITITEGFLDAMSIDQVQGGKYPVVSLPKGSNNGYAAIRDNLDYLLGFKYVVLALDNDEAGIKARDSILQLLDHTKVRLLELPLKDANDMLKADRGAELQKLIMFAKEYRPCQIVTVSDVIEEVLVQPQYGIAYPYKTMNDITYGMQMGEIHVFVGANGVGKTELIKELMFHFLSSFHIGLFSFEQNPESTIRRIVGSKVKERLHLPGARWDETEIREEAMKLDQKIWLYKKAASATLDDIFNAIRYLAKAKNCKLFIIDNLKGLKLGYDNDKAVELMTSLQALCKELQVNVWLLSHVNKDGVRQSTHVGFSSKVENPHGNLTEEQIKETMEKFKVSWETGRIPTKENVEGSSVICDLADYVWALARNTQSENIAVRSQLNIVPRKCRLDSSLTGKMFSLRYTLEGRYEEITNPGEVFK